MSICRDCIYYEECIKNKDRQVEDDSLECLHFEEDDKFYIK